MAKKEEKQAGTSTAGTQGPEETADNNQGPGQGPATAVIETVEDLEACYPVLVKKIREQIVLDIQHKSGPNLNVPGFLLEVDDPFAEGTLRTFQKLKGVSGLRLPYVLPFKDKMTKATLKNYILRANGGGDIKRAETARKSMERCE